MPLPTIPLPDLESWLLNELGRARVRIARLQEAHPQADRAQIAQRLIDEKKRQATSGGLVVGLFGWLSIPADVAMVGWMQFTLAIELALLHGVNLKSASGRAELFDLLGFKGSELGLLTLVQAAPRLARRASSALARRVGWRTVGRTVPVLAAPITAWVNNRDIQALGDEAIRRFETFRKVRTAPRELL